MQKQKKDTADADGPPEPENYFKLVTRERAEAKKFEELCHSFIENQKINWKEVKKLKIIHENVKI